MRSASIACVALGFAAGLAQPSSAQDPPEGRLNDGPYLELQGGWSIFADPHLEIESPAVTGDGRAEYLMGGTVGAAAGVRIFDMLRLEGCASYRSANLDEVRAAGIEVGHGDGYASAYTFLGNAYLDIPIPVPWITPYVGGGAGVAIFTAQIDDNNLDIDDDQYDTGFAWNAMAGVLIPILRMRNLEFDVRYRYVTAPNLRLDAELLGSADGTVDTELEAHETVIALRVLF
jgi:opacity protein-like surface antigen